MYLKCRFSMHLESEFLLAINGVCQRGFRECISESTLNGLLCIQLCHWFGKVSLVVNLDR